MDLLDGMKLHVAANRSQRYHPCDPRSDSRLYGDVGDGLCRQQLPRRRNSGDPRCDVDRRTENVVRPSDYRAMVDAGPRQRNSNIALSSIYLISGPVPVECLAH